MELLSYPLPSYALQSGSQQQPAAGSSAEAQSQRQRQQQQQQRRQQYGVRLRVAGSGWTPAMALDVVELSSGTGTSGQQKQVGRSLGMPACLPACRFCPGLYLLGSHSTFRHDPLPANLPIAPCPAGGPAPECAAGAAAGSGSGVWRCS